MSRVIIGIICFIAGSAFGAGWMALFSAEKQADADMEREVFPDE